jgi:SLT domain-containing protein
LTLSGTGLRTRPFDTYTVDRDGRNYTDMHSDSQQPEPVQNGTIQASRGRTSRGLARYIRRYLAAARRSGDPRRITNAQAEVAALRTAVKRSRPADGAP